MIHYSKFQIIKNLSYSVVYSKFYLISVQNTIFFLKQSNFVLYFYPKFDFISSFQNIHLVFFIWKSSLLQLRYICDLFTVHYPDRFYTFTTSLILRNFFTSNVVLFSYSFNKKLDNFSFSLCIDACNWLEREIFDLFGIYFLNHKNLRRILTDYGFCGFPLLKDFPIFGYKEIRYDLEKQQLLYTNVCLAQSWRNYFFGLQWEIEKK